MPYNETCLTSFYGTRVFLRIWTPDQPPRAVLVLVHGLAEHAGRYRHVVETFLQDGYVIFGHDHRGFGKSEGKRGHWERFEDVLRDMKLVVDRAKAMYPDLPFGMFAHSMGGTIGVQYLYHHDGFQAAVISAPGFGPGPDQNQLLLRLLPILSRLMPRHTLDRKWSEEYRLSHDPAEAVAWNEDPLVHPYVTPRWAVEYLKAAKEAKTLLARLTIPILIVLGDADVTVDVGLIREAAAQAGPNVTLRVYPNAYHEVHNELPEIREAMLADVRAWLNARLFSSPESD